MTIRWLAAALAATLAACSGPKFVPLPQQPPLAGEWRLDREASDLPERPSGLVGARGGPGPPQGGRGGPPPRGRGGPSRGRRPPDPEAMRRLLDHARTAAGRLEIVQADSTVTIAYGALAPLTLYTDGRSLEREIGRGELELRAHWDDASLIVERKVEGGPELRERFKRSPDGKRLIVTTRLEGRLPRELEFRRVYVPASEEGPDPGGG